MVAAPRMTRKLPPGQLSLDVAPEAPEPPRKPKRRRFAAPPQTDRKVPPKRAEPGAALMRPPVEARCGLCGAKLTVMADAAICPECGGIVARPRPDDDGS